MSITISPKFCIIIMAQVLIRTFFLFSKGLWSMSMSVWLHGVDCFHLSIRIVVDCNQTHIYIVVFSTRQVFHILFSQKAYYYLVVDFFDTKLVAIFGITRCKIKIYVLLASTILWYIIDLGLNWQHTPYDINKKGIVFVNQLHILSYENIRMTWRSIILMIDD